MRQNRKLGTTATSHYEEDGVLRVIYHNTCVVEFDRKLKRIKLNTGGWKTATTKMRMNQASNQFGLGFEVSQKNHEWYVHFEGVKYRFDDDYIVLHSNL